MMREEKVFQPIWIIYREQSQNRCGRRTFRVHGNLYGMGRIYGILQMFLIGCDRNIKLFSKDGIQILKAEKHVEQNYIRFE